MDDRRRPDHILIRNPRGFDRQVILDVAVTSVNLFGRAAYDDPYMFNISLLRIDTNKRLTNISVLLTIMDYNSFLLFFLIQVKYTEKLNALLRSKFVYN